MTTEQSPVDRLTDAHLDELARQLRHPQALATPKDYETVRELLRAMLAESDE